MNKTFLFISCTVIDTEPKKQVSLKLLFLILNFLVSQQESNKEMRPLKRRGRLAARKVPNFIRHTVSELIGLSIKGKT
ncbi:MAG: hypothetical protein ACLU4K_01940 [Oscillospiraceae bacterium]